MSEDEEIQCSLPGLSAAGAGLHDNPCAVSTLSLVSVLIVFGISFEHFFIGFLDKHAEGTLAPLVHVLLSELTLMGGLGLVVFVMGKTDSLESLSRHFLKDETELNEMLENLHMILFLVVIVFLLQALFLIWVAKRQEKSWHNANKLAICNPQSLIQNHFKEIRKSKRLCSGNGQKVTHDQLSFLALRTRFIVTSRKNGINLTPDFSFDQYLGILYGHMIGEFVDIPVKTWVVRFRQKEKKKHTKFHT